MAADQVPGGAGGAIGPGGAPSFVPLDGDTELSEEDLKKPVLRFGPDGELPAMPGHADHYHDD